MLKIKKSSIEDIAFGCIIVFTLAAHDYKLLFAVVQVIGSIIIYTSCLSNKVIQREKLYYVAWQVGLIFLGGLSLSWAVNTSSVLLSVRSLIQVTLVGFAIILYVRSDERMGKLFNYILMGASFLIIRMIIQVPITAWGSERVGNYIGYGNNGAANILAYSALFAFYLYKQRNKSYMFFVLTFILFSFLCGSKKAVLIAILGIGTQLILNAKRPMEFIIRTFQVVLAVVIVAYCIMNIPLLYNVLGVRIERMFLAFSEGKGGDMSTLDRIYFIQRAIEVFLQNPIHGVGLDNFRHYNYNDYYAHNNYVELAADLGVLGVIAYYWFPLSLLIKSGRCLRSKEGVFVFVLMCVILTMDFANVSYFVDSIQLFIAAAFTILLQIYKKSSYKVVKENNNAKITLYINKNSKRDW